MIRHSQLQKYQTDPAISLVTGVCPHDCPDTCSWQVAVERTSRRAVDIWGHPDHPITQGRLCGKVDRYLERTYHTGRLTAPLKRTGPKGSGQFRPVSWDDAIAEIAVCLQRIIDEYGPKAVLPYSYAGTMGLLQGEGMAQRFFNRLGASQLARTICSEAAFEGYQYTLGKAIGIATEDYAHARLIILWGTNTLTSNQHLWPFVLQARQRGGRVIVIDPARTKTARASDAWIPIRPGTDGALALAMMHVIISEKLYDADYVERYCVGFELLAERVLNWSLEKAEAITSVPADRIRQLAREYALTRPAAIRINYGIQHHKGGGMAVRNITCLPALVGAWRDVGGGIQLSTSGNFPLDRTSLQRPDLRQPSTPRIINMNRLGDALSTDPDCIARAHYHPRPIDPTPTAKQAGTPIKALIVYNSNPAAVAPDQSSVVRGLSRSDLFTVVLEHFLTDTAAYADYLLPATTQLEHWDLIRPYGHLFLSLNRQAISPVGQSLPNSEIFRRLAAAMGYDEPCYSQSDEEILQEFIENQTDPVFNPITWSALLKQGFVRLNLPDPYLPFAQGNFPTPSGKCEFYSDKMADDGYDPLPAWTPPRSLTQPHNDDRRSLICISPPAHSFLNSSFVNMDSLRKREKEPVMWIHPHDAVVCKINDGEAVRVWNEQGSVTLTARVTEDIIPGTMLAPGIWWGKYSHDGRNINQITSQGEADMGAGSLFYDVRVWVETTGEKK